MGKQEKKQFTLNSKENCCIYLCRIISSSELCMDRFKKYNKQVKEVLEKYDGKDNIPYDVYGEMCDKTYNIIGYLLNLLGDCQDSSISYFKYRQHIQKRINKGNSDIQINTITDEVSEIMSEFNKMRNWQNHVPESILVAEIEMVNDGKMELPMDPVEITHYKYVTYEYFNHLYLSNMEFYESARKIIQSAKKEYSLLMGKKIMYLRVYIDKPMGINKSDPTKQSAKVQGLKGEE